MGNEPARDVVIVSEAQVEAAARASCKFEGSDPDEELTPGYLRWHDRAECSRLMLEAALTAAPARKGTKR